MSRARALCVCAHARESIGSALGSTGTGEAAAPAELAVRLATLGTLPGLSFGPARRLSLRALPVALLARIAVLPPLTVMATVGLGRRPLMLLLRLSLWSRLEPLERFGSGIEVGRQGHDRNALARRALDVAQVTALLVAAEGDRNAVGASTRGAADAVDILLRHIG